MDGSDTVSAEPPPNDAVDALAETVPVDLPLSHDAGGLSTDEIVRLQRPTVVRRPPPLKFGAIDVGTNSIHLIMAEISPQGDFHVLGRDRDMVLLGKGGFLQHVLTPRAIDEGIAALKRFVKMAHLKGITRLLAVATSAVREATNGGDFVQRVRDELGIELHVISAEEEARLIYLGVRHAVDLGDADNLLLDIGGGSLEIVVGNAHRPEVVTSLKLGASRLGELFLRSDPPASSELKAMRQHIEKSLRPVLARVGSRDFARCITTSGTVENIATICAHRRGKTEIEPTARLRMERAELKALLGDLSGMTRTARLKVPGMDARRVDAILPATTLLHVVTRAFGVTAVEHCDSALREGIIVNHIATHRARLLARATWPDPRLRSVIQLAERCGYRQDHAEQVTRLALMLFDQLRPLHGLDDSYRELLRYACLLHDVGYLISHQSHHKHSFYLIRNGGLQGFAEQEIEIIANVARYHRKGRPKKSHYSYQQLAKAHRPVVRRLIPLLRLANALDRTHFSAVDAVECRFEPGVVKVHVRTSKDGELEIWTARQHVGLFEREYGRRVEIVLAEPAAKETSNGTGQ